MTKRLRDAGFWIAIGVLLSILAGCSEAPPMPTAPSAIASIDPYRWDMIAPGCAPDTPIPALQGVSFDREVVDRVEGTTLRLFYSRGVAANGDQLFITGDFKRLGKVWALCSWALVGRSVRE